MRRRPACQLQSISVPPSIKNSRQGFGGGSLLTAAEKRRQEQLEEQAQRLQEIRWKERNRQQESIRKSEAEAQQLKEARRREACATVLSPQWEREDWASFQEEEREAILQLKARLTPTGTITLKPPAGRRVKVNLQREFTTTRSVIPTTLANILCSRFTIDQLLLSLNTLFDEVYDLSLMPHLSKLLHSYVTSGTLDFGMAFARLRRQWETGDFEDFEARLEKVQKEFDLCRESLVQGDLISSKNCPPRRLWDVYSNRVVHASLSVPLEGTTRRARHEGCVLGYGCLCDVAKWYALSHSWVHEKERQWVESPINGGQWRLPLPCDVSLDQVRIEALNIIAKNAAEDHKKDSSYVWLDLLCLRQADPLLSSPDDTRLRISEHAIDVPTIGSIYDDSSANCIAIVQYFSGLGRPFVQGDKTDERHWINRAWTLQELGLRNAAVTAGITEGSPANGRDACAPTDKTAFFDKLFNAFVSPQTGFEPFRILLEMSRRSSVNPADKIAGLIYPLDCEGLYTYSAKDTTEEAWMKLVQVLAPRCALNIALAYPLAGASDKLRLLPSWNQIVDAQSFEKVTNLFKSIDRDCDQHRSGRRTDLIPVFVMPPAIPSTPLRRSRLGHFHGHFFTWDHVNLDMSIDITGSAPSRTNRVPDETVMGLEPLWGTLTFLGREDLGITRTRQCMAPKGIESGSYAVAIVELAEWPTHLEWSILAFLGTWGEKKEGRRTFFKVASIAIIGDKIFEDFQTLRSLKEDIVFG